VFFFVYNILYVEGSNSTILIMTIRSIMLNDGSTGSPSTSNGSRP